ncbi:MAG: hypothetical protein ACI808_000265 [Paraglaciecola sp.]|jgi:hypothetical protein
MGIPVVTVSSKKYYYVFWFIVGSLSFCLTNPCHSGELSGHAGLEARISNHHVPNKNHDNIGYSALVDTEFYHDWDEGRQRISINSFLRVDKENNERSHVDFREFYWSYGFDEKAFDLYVGLRIVFWGVTESLHLVDVINQIDLLEGIDTEDKLGQPMVQLSWEKEWGNLDLFYLPYFRERNFSGLNTPLTTTAVVDTYKAKYQSGSENWHPDIAVRWSQTRANWDVGLVYFYGTNREPILWVDQTSAQPVLLPHYNILRQISIDIQYTTDSWLWKLEALNRSSNGQQSSAFVGGFEYTFFDVYESGIDVGFISEFQYDDISGEIQHVGDNDIATGARLTFNDTSDTNLLALSTVDIDTGVQFYTLELDRRIGYNWQIELQARFFVGGDNNTLPFNIFDKKDSFQLTMRYFF